ncbi:MAG: HD-GYP domain-containing protein [Lachnospiraceae bacterium]
MKRVRTAELHPGMKTAEDVYSYNNQMVLPQGTVLTDKMITRLEFYSILSIQVTDESGPFKRTVSHVQEGAPYSDKIKSSKQFREFEKALLRTAESFKNDLHAIVEFRTQIDPKKLCDSVTGLITKNMTGSAVFDMLHNMREYDDYTYIHSINVSLICHIFGKWLKLSKREIEIVTLCGLLHDVGKLMIPESIMKKPARLTLDEYNIVKTHALQGYNILKDYDINVNIKDVALMHHERCDGSGYPLGLTGDKINPYAKIVAIADVYDAMTSARTYRGPLCPYKVIGIFESEGLQKYEGKYILTFLEHIAETYMSNRIRLSNGLEGDVVFMNKNSLSKPLIQCGDDFIDLSRDPAVYIETFV